MRLRLRSALRTIQQADDIEIQQILAAIISRYNAYHPDQEILFLSMHKEQVQRKKDIESIVTFLQNHH